MRIIIGEKLFRLCNRDGSSRWIDEMDPPATLEHVVGGEGARPFISVLQYYRLRAALGAVVDPQDVVREARNSHYALVSQGWRAIVRLAALWGAVLRSETPETAQAVAEIRSMIAVLDRRPTGADLGWYAFQAARPELLALLVNAAAAAGGDIFEAVKRLFVERWFAQSVPDDEEVRRVLMAFLDVLGAEPRSVRSWLGTRQQCSTEKTSAARSTPALLRRARGSSSAIATPRCATRSWASSAPQASGIGRTTS